uniref:Secreted protein n=1 Tax=Romanomermis culicivorax TaxID=13658 RepID=A0A915JEN6_ROMCU
MLVLGMYLLIHSNASNISLTLVVANQDCISSPQAYKMREAIFTCRVKLHSTVISFLTVIRICIKNSKIVEQEWPKVAPSDCRLQAEQES